ncbi:MAG: helix-turn-helix transcriptional regulator [Muricoprocola sp.]
MEIYRQSAEMLLEIALYYMRKPSYYKLFCVGQIKVFLHILLNNMSHKILTTDEIAKQRYQSARLQRLIQFVEANYMHKIRLSDFAESEGKSMSCISHFMKEMTHQSFQQYVNTVRFNEACKMIATEQMKMIDISMACGFSDYKYFSNTFIKRTGMTPEMYRQHMEDEQDTLSNTQEGNRPYRSLYSVERFYTPDKSVEMIEKLRKNLD